MEHRQVKNKTCKSGYVQHPLLPLNRIKIRMIDLQAIAVLLKTVEMLAGRSFFSFYWHL